MKNVTLSAPTYNQAQKIIDKFGGPYILADALGVAPSTVYRWTYGRDAGTDGVIPSVSVPKIQRAARIHGIVLTPQDWLPERKEIVCPLLAPSNE